MQYSNTVKNIVNNLEEEYNEETLAAFQVSMMQ